MHISKEKKIHKIDPQFQFQVEAHEFKFRFG